MILTTISPLILSLFQKVSPKSILIAGESSGGMLTMLVAQSIAARGLPPPAGLWAISPWSGSQDEAIKARQDRDCETDVMAANTEDMPLILVRT